MPEAGTCLQKGNKTCGARRGIMHLSPVAAIGNRPQSVFRQVFADVFYSSQ